MAQKPKLPDAGSRAGFKGAREIGMWKHGQGKFHWKDVGAWSFMVKGFSTGSSWTTGPLLIYKELLKHNNKEANNLIILNGQKF